MKHIHHILPKHRGGSDEPSNLIELSISEHAKAHKTLWAQHGHIEDFIAWKCLSGRRLSESDRILLAKSGFIKYMSNPKNKESWKHNIRKARKSQVITEEHKKNISISLKRSYNEGRKVYKKPSSEVLLNNYNKNKEKMAENRKTSSKWKASVTSKESREKRRKNSKKSFKILIDGNVYDSIRQAAKESGYSYYTIRSMIRKGLL